MNAALVSKLGTADVDTVMAHANHDRTAPDSLGLAGYAGGFKFDSTDNGDCTNYPQGISSSRSEAASTAMPTDLNTMVLPGGGLGLVPAKISPTSA